MKEQSFKFAIQEMINELDTGVKHKVIDHRYSEAEDCWFYILESYEGEILETTVEETEDNFIPYEDSLIVVGDITDIQEHWEKYYNYLEELRASGSTNMYMSAPKLAKEFYEELDLDQAGTVLRNWMHNYSELNKKYDWKSDEEDF